MGLCQDSHKTAERGSSTGSADEHLQERVWQPAESQEKKLGVTTSEYLQGM